MTTTWGVLSAIFITGGLVSLSPRSVIWSQLTVRTSQIPQYVEIYRFKAVIGISLIFLLVDLLGGVFSLLSLGTFSSLPS